MKRLWRRAKPVPEPAADRVDPVDERPDRRTVAGILGEYAPGSGDWTWTAEFGDIVMNYGDGLVDLLGDVRQQGILEPLLLGDDGRVWDGHHRLLVAHLLDLPDVPVVYGRTVADQRWAW